jgi:hypothetical protein
MQTITFRGYSDDIVYVKTAKHDEEDEYHVSINDEHPYVGTFHVGKLFVVAFYSPHNSGCWGFGVCQMEEGINLPNWPVRFKTHPKRKYSVVLEIDCPDDVRVFMLKD